MDVVDLTKYRARNRMLLIAARMVFGQDAYAVQTQDSGSMSMVFNEDGIAVATAWLDEFGKPEFQPLVHSSLLN